MTAYKRRWLRFSLGQIMLEVALLGILFAAWRFAGSTPDFLLLRIAALTAAAGSAVGNFFGYAWQGAVIGLLLSPLIVPVLFSFADGL